jgi:transketolase
MNNKINNKIRYNICKISHQSKAPHLGSCLSIVDILIEIYFGKCFSLNQRSKNVDTFILSKGHAAYALYSVLAEKKLLSKKKLKTFAKEGSLLEEHPNSKLIGITCSTGSLGHGLSFGSGIAFANKLKKIKKKIIVLMSDGECNAGTVWEAAGLASAQNLNNLIAIIDYNKWQATGRSNIISGGVLSKKWQGFGWNSCTINGHNPVQIKKAFLKAKKSKKPFVIIANTVKGKGIKFMEDDNNWHYRIPNLSEIKIIKKILKVK